MLRRSMLFVPGNVPAMIQNADVFGSDSIIFDLEDSVPTDEKDAARILVKNALAAINYKVERVVRVNAIQTIYFNKDVETIVPSKPNAIMLPKTEKKDDILLLEKRLSEIEGKENINQKIEIISLIETSLGVENVFQIVNSSDRITAVLFGAEDYTANIGAYRTKEGIEVLYARSRVVGACASSMAQAIDTPFITLNDEEGLRKDSVFAKKLGFAGKAVISPGHVGIVNETFSPTLEEIEFAKRVIIAVKESHQTGRGAITVDGRMVDTPIVIRAKRILEMAKEGRG